MDCLYVSYCEFSVKMLMQIAMYKLYLSLCYDKTNVCCPQQQCICLFLSWNDGFQAV